MNSTDNLIGRHHLQRISGCTNNLSKDLLEFYFSKKKYISFSSLLDILKLPSDYGREASFTENKWLYENLKQGPARVLFLGRYIVMPSLMNL